MLTLRETVLSDLTKALKEGRKEEAGTLRFLMAQVKNREIEDKKREEGLNDGEMLEVIMREAKKRRESIGAFKKGGREDLVKKEEAELKILEKYLPAQMSEEAIRNEVKKAITETGATNIKDLGNVMSVLMSRLKGKADGALVSNIVKEMLQ